MNRPDVDILVVGAGAGGAATAYYLAQAGLDVLVVDKARLPRYKACGGAIPRHTLDQFPFSFDAVVQAEPTSVRLVYKGQWPVELSLPDRPVAMVMRSDFDAFLLSRANVEVWQETVVTGVRETPHSVDVSLGDRTMTARYLVGADGAASRVARYLGLRQNRLLGGTLEAAVPLQGNQRLQEEFQDRALFSFGVVDWGYGWVFPKGDHVSVGIGRFRRGRHNLHRLFREEMTRLGIDLDGIKIHGHPIPSYQARSWPWWHGRFRSRQPWQTLSTSRCLLVGDAAGLVDPFLGEGIRYAIASGKLAAAAIAAGDLSGYERAIWQVMGHSLATAGLTAGLFYRWPWLCYRLGMGSPAAVRQFIAILAEETSYVGIGRRLFQALAVGQRSNPVGEVSG